MGKTWLKGPGLRLTVFPVIEYLPSCQGGRGASLPAPPMIASQSSRPPAEAGGMAFLQPDSLDKLAVPGLNI